MSVEPEEEEKYVDELTEAITEALSYTAHEPILLVRLEKFFRPTPSKLASTEEEAKALNQRIGSLCRRLGGPPPFIIPREDEPLATYDTYAEAALNEILHSFKRCRRSVCRTHVCLIGSEFYKSHPASLADAPTGAPEALKQLQPAMFEMFWEHAETSYIRLASFWDRVGQLLDFVFFNIRQYERDGFPSVILRIRANYVRLFSNIESDESWKYLWDYSKSESADGFGWLVSRRNLLVHSLHLQALTSDKENELFRSAFNHLDESARRKLKPENPAAELEMLHTHLDAAAVLFHAVLRLCEVGVTAREEEKWRSA